MSVYERANWPHPDNNPLVQLWLRGDDWYSSVEIEGAFAASGVAKRNASYLSLWPDLAQSGTATVEGGLLVASPVTRSGNRGRHYSRQSLFLIIIRSRCAASAAFQVWFYDFVMGEACNVQA